MSSQADADARRYERGLDATGFWGGRRSPEFLITTPLELFPSVKLQRLHASTFSCPKMERKTTAVYRITANKRRRKLQERIEDFQNSLLVTTGMFTTFCLVL